MGWRSTCTCSNARKIHLHRAHRQLSGAPASPPRWRFRGYTYKRRPVRLIFHEPFATREEAFAAERQVKSWSREKKLALARRDWQTLQELAVRRTPRRWLTERTAPAHPSSKPQDEREEPSSLD